MIRSGKRFLEPTQVPDVMADHVRVQVAEAAEHPGCRGRGNADRPLHPAYLHAAFERIHSFLDGTGRTGHLALNRVLVRLGYPLVIMFKRGRTKYLDALDQADKHGRAVNASLTNGVPGVGPPPRGRQHRHPARLDQRNSTCRARL